MIDQVPSPAQLRSALGLLNWENNDLAKACQITPQSVSNIKRGATRPQPRILASIRRVLEMQGIEFLDHSGVRLKPEGVEVFQGRKDFRRFYDLLHDRMLHHHAGVYVSGVDERQFEEYLGDYAAVHIGRMKELLRQRRKLDFKVMLCEGDTHFLGSSYIAYRWQRAESFGPAAFYVFADYLALISFQGENAPKLVLIHSTVFADAYRRQFMEQWAHARIPPGMSPAGRARKA